MIPFSRVGKVNASPQPSIPSDVVSFTNKKGFIVAQPSSLCSYLVIHVSTCEIKLIVFYLLTSSFGDKTTAKIPPNIIRELPKI